MTNLAVEEDVSVGGDLAVTGGSSSTYHHFSPLGAGISSDHNDAYETLSPGTVYSWTDQNSNSNGTVLSYRTDSGRSWLYDG